MTPCSTSRVAVLALFLSVPLSARAADDPPAKSPEADAAGEIVEIVEAPPKIWEGRLEAGVNGSAGNTEQFNIRFGAHAIRKTPDDVLKLDLIYAKSNKNGVEIENKALFEARNEWIFDESPWFLFAYMTTEFDEFKDWDLRFTGGGGLGYKWIKTDRTSLASRLGAGFSREVGGFDDQFVPEMNLGLDFEHKLTDRQKFTATIDVFPDISAWSDYRATAKAAWECLIDPVHNLSLQIGILDRYDSTPGDAKANDLDYFGLLVWKF